MPVAHLVFSVLLAFLGGLGATDAVEGKCQGIQAPLILSLPHNDRKSMRAIKYDTFISYPTNNAMAHLPVWFCCHQNGIGVNNTNYC